VLDTRALDVLSTSVILLVGLTSASVVTGSAWVTELVITGSGDDVDAGISDDDNKLVPSVGEAATLMGVSLEVVTASTV
jgi:hypothetical protein